jgi:phosphoribosylformylglycinamidine cyclo-ligase
MSNLYNQRGVSADKEDVHVAVKDLDKGLFPNAFCRIYPDYLSGDDTMCNIMHADGAGTKSVLAYLYWKETGDASVWRGIAQDALVMNIDDMLCVGAVNHFAYTSTIGRNKSLIPGEVIAEIINGTQAFIDEMKKHDVHIHFMGGETADVGDVVRTIIVDGTMMCRMKKEELINAHNVVAGNVIVSLASFGQASYETEYNSGMGSNGLTSARHDMLHKYYAEKYPECVDPNLPSEVIYNGNFKVTDEVGAKLNIGKMILSPTRTYAPILLDVLKNHREKINAIIHCSGGGQTKCLHYLPNNVRVIKNNLIPEPELFTLIQKGANTSWKEMYKVFNMGNRMEIYTDEKTAEEIISISKKYNVHAQISGYIEASDKKELIIKSEHGEFIYQ